MTNDGQCYGRSEQEWDELVEAAETFLVERAKLGRTTSYTEMNAALANRTGQGEFDFSQQSDRTAVGELLGRVVDRSFAESRVMLSAIVIYLGANDAGSGFYAKARHLGALPGSASAEAKEAFWVGQVAAVYRHYGGA